MFTAMTNQALTEPPAVVETRLAHAVHRVGTSLLAEAAIHPSVPLDTLASLRDFLVANLRHHHETEDHDLWPRILVSAPDVQQALDSLSGEHEHLDVALDRLAAVSIGDDEGVRPELRDAAAEVRDTVLEHLAHEEPVLFPALRDHISAAEWTEFAQRVIATTPPVAGHLMVGFLDEVGTHAEVELVLAGIPEPVHALLPAMRAQAAVDLRLLRGFGS
ncbi:hemerythrin domain-containing protein [Streptomyces sp. NPDC047706]|uniref:hemerythrin domain-containing protein n=1 Tax=Streptomyces sp. NPDC047706 TaxID=3365486 RepID=UPI003715D260